MKIYINKEILDRFKAETISIDYVGTIIVILMCLYEKNYELLDEIDDNNTSRRILMLYRHLHRKGLIVVPEVEDVEHDKVHYILTERGAGLVNFLLSFDDSEMEVKKEMLQEIVKVENEQKPELWIADWLRIFPEGRQAGRPLRTNTRDCLDRMTWFLKEFSYTKDEIFAATRNYIDEQAASPDGFKYTRNSTYFISKGRGVNERISDLATACEKLRSAPMFTKDFIDRDSI